MRHEVPYIKYRRIQRSGGEGGGGVKRRDERLGTYHEVDSMSIRTIINPLDSLDMCLNIQIYIILFE